MLENYYRGNTALCYDKLINIKYLLSVSVPSLTLNL